MSNNQIVKFCLTSFFLSVLLSIFSGLIIHILVAVFTFLGLAIVCDDYFVASLDRICEELKLSPDIAGASFMVRIFNSGP